MSIRVLPVTREDVIPLDAVRVTDDQRDFVASNPVTIAQVRFFEGAYDFCIWEDDRRVGMIAIIDNTEHHYLDVVDDQNAAYIWRLLIGIEDQGKGFGTAAIQFAEGWAKKRGRTIMQIQAVETNAPALALYQKLGYTLTGKRFQDEVQLAKAL